MSGSLTDEVISTFLPGYHTWPKEVQQSVFQTVEVIIRKSAHFGLYGVLGALSFFAASRFLSRRRIQIALAFGVSVLYAVSDEIHQLYVPGRSCEFRDVCIDAAGALVGILFIWLVLAVAHRVSVRKRQKLQVKIG